MLRVAKSITSSKFLKSLVLVTAMAAALSPASAGSLKDEPAPAADPSRKFEWSFNIGMTSDYVFRGISQSAERPALQGGIDASYGMFYVGAWASSIDFGKVGGFDVAGSEVDLYAGIKPTLGPITFDFGVIYYAYPAARDAAAQLDYVELKAGASASPFKNLTLGVTGFYSPEYTAKQGEVYTVEGLAAYELPKLHTITPTLSALIGYQKGDLGAGYVTAGPKDNYLYWNAGVALAIDKVTLDFRYWDTNIDSATCSGPIFQCDQRFVASAKITLP